MVVTAKTFATQALDEKQECHFFETIRLANGTFKTTAFRRLDDVNRMVADRWKQMGASPAAILDVAVSSGISSLEWAEQLIDQGFDVHLTATDINFASHLVSVAPGLEVLLDPSGHVLQYSVFGQALPGFPNWLQRLGGARIVRMVADGLIRLKGAKRLFDRARLQIMLVNSAALKHPRISFLENDLFAPLPASLVGRFDAIRAANILNLAYFGREDIQRAVQNFKRMLSGAGAYLIVVRTMTDGSNHGSLFQLNEDNAFNMLARIGGGSEIEPLVLSGIGCSTERQS